ncbi:MAG TPA: hypothetical protein VI072_04985 [Polyangiaceae bacterium]
MRRHLATSIAPFIVLSAAPAFAQAPSYLEFEAGPVRPLALSADKTKLYACNIPDNRLEIFDVSATGISHSASVPVGMSPVAVAQRTAGEVWVVNHLSDSVSVVDVAASPPRVVRTLLVGDEPRDVVFAANGRAFVTTAHRGEHRADDSIAAVAGAGEPQLTTPGVNRADVWVFDPASLGTTLGGTPLRIVTLFGDTPRALAVNGNTVYAAIFYSGNQTAAVNETVVCDGFQLNVECAAQPGDTNVSPNGLANGRMPGGMPPPSRNISGVLQPEAGLIVKFDNASGQWKDSFGRNWSNGIRFFLPDKDVFSIDATTLSPVSVWQHVGTTLFNMAVNPANGKVYVSNTDSQNLTRFEGPGTHVRNSVPGYPGPTTVQGNLAHTRITVLAPSASVTPRRLNTHINYAVTPAPAGTASSSLSTPLDMVFSGDGSRVYLAAYGSNKIGVIPTAALENGTFSAASAAPQYIPTRPGPAGLALDEARGVMYVLTRFDNSVSRIDLSTRAETQHVRMPTPEPLDVSLGRPFLYDAVATSSNGEASCASCHIFGDMDHLAWDLGNPDDPVTSNPLPILLTIGEVLGNDQNGGASISEFHPMKGLMTTQTLKGMVNHGHMHWRGDRSNGALGRETRSAPPFDSRLSFMNFIVATSGLNGRAQDISEADMDRFTRFALRMTLPPNPIRRLDNNLQGVHRQLTRGNPHLGREYFFGRVGTPSNSGGLHLADGVSFGGFGFTCEGCHTLEPQNGFFGTDGTATFEGLEQIFKVAQLRNLYTKVGMFGHPKAAILTANASGSFAHQGDQIRGFAYEHEGSVDTVFTFMQAILFEEGGFLKNEPNIGFDNDQQRRDVEAFVMAFDNDLPPIAGQQITLTQSNAATVGGRIDLMIARAGAGFSSKLLGSGARECDLIAKTVVNGKPRGYLRRADGLFLPDDGSAAVSDATVRALANTAGQSVTYTCAPFGSGQRMGIDRDLDTVLDGRDNCPAAVNGNQTDSDGDGIGDVCDGTTGGGPGCTGGTAASALGGLPLAFLGGLTGLGGLVWRRRRRG